MLHERSNDTASLAEDLKLQEKMTFADVFWICYSQFKEKHWNQDTVQFEIATYEVLHERSNKTASFAEHLKSQD